MGTSSNSRHYCWREVLPFTAMLAVEISNVGVNVLYKAAVTKGLSYHVFMSYSYGISAIAVLPLAYFFHRKTSLPPITIPQLGKFFILGFLGFIGQILGNKGIALSSPTLGSAMSNLNPATTFILAVLFGMEKIKITRVSSQAKIMGTLVTIAGAFVVVLYEGPLLITKHLHHYVNKLTELPIINPNYSHNGLTSAQSNWILGGALLASCYIISAFWYIVQTKVVKEFPAEFIIVFFYNLWAFIISLPVCFIFEPNLSSWNVPADIQLLSIVFSGIMGSGFGIMVHTWVLHVKGPVYVALFRPFSIAVSAILGVIFLGDDLYLGSVIGSLIISMGFYTVIWGKWKEEYNNAIESSNEGVVPLLRNYTPSTTKDNSIE